MSQKRAFRRGVDESMFIFMRKSTTTIFFDNFEFNFVQFSSTFTMFSVGNTNLTRTSIYQ